MLRKIGQDGFAEWTEYFTKDGVTTLAVLIDTSLDS